MTLVFILLWCFVFTAIMIVITDYFFETKVILTLISVIFLLSGVTIGYYKFTPVTVQHKVERFYIIQHDGVEITLEKLHDYCVEYYSNIRRYDIIEHVTGGRIIECSKNEQRIERFIEL